MIERTASTFPRNEFMQRFDGSKWRIFDIEGGQVVLTENGQELFGRNPGLRASIREYRHDLLNPFQTPNVRRHFRQGGNSDVFEVGNTGLVMKETHASQSIWFSLERLDYLYAICQRSLPSYVRVPEHYGALFSSGLSRQYLLMQKANDGITIDDHLSNGDTNEALVVKKAFDKAKKMLDDAIAKHAREDGFPDNLLVDWHEGNVIVDFSSPTKDMPFTLCIIDQ